MMTNKSDEFFLDRIDKLIEAERERSSFFYDNQFPCWLKIIQGDRLIMDKVNAAYTRETGVTPSAYLGEEDHKVWGPHTGEHFNEFDKIVVETKGPVQSIEFATNPLNGLEQVWIGWKWPYFYKGEIVGIWGCAIPVLKEVYDNNMPIFDYLMKF